MPRTTTKEYPELNRNVPLGTGIYYMPELEQGIAAPTGIDPGLIANLEGSQGNRGTSIPHKNTWWPPSESQECGRATLKTIINMETISVLISFPHSSISCLIITIVSIMISLRELTRLL